MPSLICAADAMAAQQQVAANSWQWCNKYRFASFETTACTAAYMQAEKQALRIKLRRAGTSADAGSSAPGLDSAAEVPPWAQQQQQQQPLPPLPPLPHDTNAQPPAASHAAAEAPSTSPVAPAGDSVMLQPDAAADAAVPAAGDDAAAPEAADPGAPPAAAVQPASEHPQTDAFAPAEVGEDAHAGAAAKPRSLSVAPEAQPSVPEEPAAKERQHSRRIAAAALAAAAADALAEGPAVASLQRLLPWRIVPAAAPGGGGALAEAGSSDASGQQAAREAARRQAAALAAISRMVDSLAAEKRSYLAALQAQQVLRMLFNADVLSMSPAISARMLYAAGAPAIEWTSPLAPAR